MKLAPDIQIKNFIILLGKYFIFKNKCLETIPSFIHFKSYLNQRLKIEKESYVIRDKIAKYERKWWKCNAFIN